MSLSHRPLALALSLALAIGATAGAAETKWDVGATHAKGKVVRFSTDEEALAIANGSEYGLGSGLWTQNLSRAHKMAEAIWAAARAD